MKICSMIQSVRAASFAGAGWMCLCRHVMSCINGTVEQAIPCAMDGDALSTFAFVC